MLCYKCDYSINVLWRRTFLGLKATAIERIVTVSDSVSGTHAHSLLLTSRSV